MVIYENLLKLNHSGFVSVYEDKLLLLIQHREYLPCASISHSRDDLDILPQLLSQTKNSSAAAQSYEGFNIGTTLF